MDQNILLHDINVFLNKTLLFIQINIYFNNFDDDIKYSILGAQSL